MTGTDSKSTPSNGSLQRVLDGFHSVRKWLINRLAFCSLRIYGLEDVSLKHVECGCYSRHLHSDRKLENAKALDVLLAASRECLDNANNRRAAITDKCKTLLTISSLMLGFVGFFSPKAFAFDSIWMRVIGFVAVIAVMNTITLLLVFFDVGRDTEISLDQQEVELDAENFKKSLINLYLRCQVDMDNRTNYLVDLYKAARFFALSGFTFLVLLFSLAFVFSSPDDQAKRIAHELRDDPRFLQLVRELQDTDEQKFARPQSSDKSKTVNQ